MSQFQSNPMPTLTPTLPGKMPAATAVPSVTVAADAQRLKKLTAELESRRISALAMYEPIHEDQRRFHESRCAQLLAIGSNRAGKTLTASVEVARFALNDDPVKTDFNLQVPQAEIDAAKRDDEGWINRRIIVGGRDLEHVGTVQYRKLFRSGAFKMIQDKATGRWRAFRPDDEDDAAREKEAKAAPPLIPASRIKSIAWENKAQGTPNVITLKNGTEFRFYSGKAEPPQGQDVDLVWLDEEIRHEQWYPEMSARLLDRKGRLIWSATPENATEALADLNDRAEDESALPDDKADVKKFFFHIEQNPHIGKKERDRLYRNLSPEMRRVKYHGEFRITGFRVYPEFDIDTHGVEMGTLPGGQVPPDWTRAMILDPGRQTCAALFGAVPPDNLYTYLYDEIYLHNGTATAFAEEFARRRGSQEFAVFIIDHQYGRQAQITTGKTLEQHYAEELKKRGISSWSTGSGFLWGSSGIKDGVEAVRKLLMIRGDGPGRGTPQLQVIKGKLPNLEMEFRKYHFKVRGGASGTQVLDEPDERRYSHLMATLRYLAMYNLRWRAKPSGAHGQKSGIQLYLEKKQRKKNPSSGGVMLGPGISIR